MTDLLKLADRIETADKGSRELDAVIRLTVYAPEGAYVEQSPINGAWCIYYGKDRSGRQRLWDGEGRKEYTTSIDAAMTLVPEGASAQLTIHPDEAWADIYRLGDVKNDGPTLSRDKALIGESDRCKTPSLALCAAALRARGAE